MRWNWDITTDEYIQRAIAIHGDKYGYELVNYVNRQTPITIICRKHGPIKINPYTHIRLKTGCPKCATDSSRKKYALTKEQFIERAKERIGDHYNFSRVEYINAHTPVLIGCPIHGWFKQYPMSIQQNRRGCPKCELEHRGENRRTGLKSFIERSKSIHGDRYNYDKVVYVNQQSRVIISCPIHGDFEQRAQDHLKGIGCSKCNYPYSKGRPKENLVDDFRKVHGDRYEYPGIPNKPRNTIKIPIRCKKHGIFYQRIANHLRGDGCPSCKNSKQENIVRRFLEYEKIKFEEQKTFSWLKRKKKMFLDFYLPEYNIGIECQGSQHFGIVSGWGYVMEEKDYIDLYERDRLKHELCKHRGIKILYYCYYKGWVPEEYIDTVYTTKKDLINAIEYNKRSLRQ